MPSSGMANQDPSTAEPRPNVLFVICDQLRADHLGFAGNPVVQTPNIDAIASGGTVFDRAYVNNAVCMPNRSTIMTGRMPSAHGVVFNDRSLDPSAATFVGQLRGAGWRTALIGKSHLQHGMSREAVYESPMAAGMVSPYEPGWDTIEHQERYEAGERIDPDDFYGFDHIELTIGHGAWSGGHHYQWAREKGVSHEQLRCGLDPQAEIAGRSGEWWQLHPAPFPDEAYSTTFVTERTIAFIEEATGDGEPWMAWCSFPDPHHPMSPPEPWFSRHSPDEIDLPSTFDDPGDGWPAHMTHIRNTDANLDGHTRYVLPFGPTPEQARGAIAATYGMVEAIDNGIGRIMGSLERLGIADDTIIIFTSDHGDMMGDHGLMLKAAMHYEGCVRVPLVVNVPGGGGRRTTSLAASIDLPHTVLELCGVPQYQSMQGASLASVLADPTATVRDHILVEEDFPASVFRGGPPVKTRTVITEDHRLTRDSNGHCQVFDLGNDPDEVIDLNHDNRDTATRDRLFGVLVDAMMGADDLTRMEPVSLDVDG